MLKRLQVMILLIISPTLYAHSLHIFAQYQENRLQGRAYYSDMTPASQTYIAVFQDDKIVPLLEGLTDQQGYFTYDIPTKSPSLNIIVEGEEGHKATIEVNNSAFTSLEQNELFILRQDINQLSHKLYWRDVIGGVGYILGIVGLWALWQSKKQRSK